MMIDRRRLMFTAAAGAGLAACGQALAQTPAASASAALTALMNGIVQTFLLQSPETLTGLGMDKGPMAAMKSRLDDRSQAKIDADRAVFRAQMNQLKAIDRNALPETEGVYHDTLTFFGDTQIMGERFPYGGGGEHKTAAIDHHGGRLPWHETAEDAARRRMASYGCFNRREVPASRVRRGS